MSESIPLASNQYLARPIMEWLRERVDGSLSGTKFGETVALIERLTRELAEEKKLSAAISRDCNAVALERNGHWSEIGRLRAALTRLTNGYKYPTEVVTIAREALSGELNSAPERQLSASEAASISQAFARSPRRVSDETCDEPPVLGAGAGAAPMPTALEAIAAHVREIEILCDACGADPAEFLAERTCL